MIATQASIHLQTSKGYIKDGCTAPAKLPSFAVSVAVDVTVCVSSAVRRSSVKILGRRRPRDMLQVPVKRHYALLAGLTLHSIICKANGPVLHYTSNMELDAMTRKLW